MLWKEAYKEKLLTREELDLWQKKLRDQKKTIVTLNGSFDLLHAGHLEILYSASKEADVFLVALNSDASIKRYKSKNRPIIPLEERLKMMAALSFVDFVTAFDETDPRALLEIVKPDVHVNGADYLPRCLEADTVEKHGGTVRYVELVPGLSTSAIITKIQSELQTCV